MINQWIGLAFELRIGLLVLIGLMMGGLANYLIYSHAYCNPRPVSPWASQKFIRDYFAAIKSASPKQQGNAKPSITLPPRSWLDRIPIVGWFRLRRETATHGQLFWVRPLLIEVAMGISLPLLYHFEAILGGQLPELARVPEFLASYEPFGTSLFVVHAILFCLMVPATFIDLDERTIPDIITIPGTLMGLFIGAITINGFMPTALPVGGAVAGINPTLFDSPWYPALNFSTSAASWWVAMMIWSGWCFALADRRWSSAIARRRGWGRALKHFCDGLFHYGAWKILLAIWLVGFVLISGVCRGGGVSWYGLFSSLVGLAVGGGVVWAIRIIASWAMNVEAMGFGDVTLMAMIGAFIGWQGSLAAFFLAPFAAIVIVLVQYLLTRDPQVPFGPYLCAGTMLTIVFWDQVYNVHFAVNLVLIGGLLLWLGIGMFAMMGVMLFVWRNVKQRLF